MKQIIQRYPIWSFLIINYAISWSFLYPSYQLILAHDGITPLALIGFIGAYGPSIAAIIVQSILDKEKLNPLLRSLIRIKTSWQVILFVLIVPILLYVLAYLMSATFLGGNLSFSWLAGLSSLPLWVLLALPFGPMGEELGWRGFLLPKLLARYSIFKSTLLVGLAWGVWHMASFTFPGAALPSFFEVSIWTIFLYFLNTIGLSFVFTYVHLQTNGSTFYAILLHAFFNVSSNVVVGLFGETDHFPLLLSSYVINFILAAICGYVMVNRHSAQKSSMIT
ncbi:MAG: type II CAAX endopeptidase family protein [Bacteroidota bacterium]